MKINSKLVFYFIALFLFVIYLFSANYIFNVLIKTGQEAKLVKIDLPSETQIIKCNIEKIEKVNLKWKEEVYLQGWVSKIINPNKKRNTYLVLKSKTNTLIFEIKNDSLNRPDVSDYFHFDRSFSNRGFELIFPLYWLKEDIYNVGFVIINEIGKYYSGSNLQLIKKNGEISLIALETETRTILHQVSVNIEKPTKELNYSFDKVEKSGDSLILYGWSFFQGMDAESQKSYFLLKGNGNIHVFGVDLLRRKDVTRYFAKSGLNLDLSGFQANIPIKNLEKGNYQVGLYTVKGDQKGMVYDKFIEIGE